MSTTLASVSPPSPRSDRLLTPPPPSCLRPRSLLKASVGLGVLAARGNDPPRPQGGDGESRRGRYSLGQRGPGAPPASGDLIQTDPQQDERGAAECQCTDHRFESSRQRFPAAWGSFAEKKESAETEDA